MVDSTLVSGRKFKFELVAPEKVEVSGMEERVLLPGEVGDFVVLPGHQLLLAALRPGVVSVMRNNTHTDYFVTGGIADIGNEHCIVLTPHIIPVTDLDATKLEEAIVKYEGKLANATETHEKEHLFEELQMLRLKLAAATKPAQHAA